MSVDFNFNFNFNFNLKMYERFLFLVVAITVLFTSHGLTDPRDVFAINNLYSSLGLPPFLRGWLASGGDPCGESWQGVACVFNNITEIRLPQVNLEGGLGENLHMFTAIITIDFDNNSIGGPIPLHLPTTLSNFTLSNNQFLGMIPETIATLSEVTYLSLSNNNLSGRIPDVFQQLSGLINLDLSGNNLIGELPLSMRSLPFLTTLNLQNNQLSGTLEVLQDLPLQDLNVENNQFSGPVPLKLLSIRNFRGSGNPFNATAILPPQASPSPQSVSMPPSSYEAYGPSGSETTNSAKSNFFTSKKIIWSALAGILIIVAIVIGLYLLISKFCRKNYVVGKSSKRNGTSARHAADEIVKHNDSLPPKDNLRGEYSKKEGFRQQDGALPSSRRTNSSMKIRAGQEIKGKRAIESLKPAEGHHTIDVSTSEVSFNQNVVKPQPASSPMPLRVIVNPKHPAELSLNKHSLKKTELGNSLEYFSIASLQQYTNSFSQENLIGRGLIGSVYRAELPDGKLLAIKKLDNRASSMQNGDDFLVLISNICKLRHPNVVDIVGYCAEHDQHLIVYEYCGNTTLHDALHLDDQMHARLSWSARIKIALGAARALEYLHEICKPPLMHRNFKSANILILEDNLVARVSDCGLAPLMTTNTVSKLSGQLNVYGYGAPEMEMGNYTHLSDIYSFGVVMLELLTGRKSFERSRPRGEQFLVRWALTQLHDIDSLSRMVDPSLNGAYPSKALSRFADIISRCLQTEPEFRPPMSEVVQDLLCIA